MSRIVSTALLSLLAFAAGVAPVLAQGTGARGGRSVEIDWNGEEATLTGTVVLSTGAGAVTLALRRHPALDRCTGQVSLPPGQATGSWNVICSNGKSASGTLSAGEPFRGAGADLDGRQVRIAVGPRGSAASAPPPSLPVPAPVQPGPTRLVLEDGAEFKCGRIEVRGLPIQQSSVRCEEKDLNITDGSATTRSASFLGAFAGSFVSISSARFTGRYHWKPLSDEDLKESVDAWAGGAAAIRDSQGARSSPFRHMAFVVNLGQRDYSCIRGNFRAEEGADGSRNSIWVGYCEPGTHGVSDENLGIVFRAITVK